MYKFVGGMVSGMTINTILLSSKELLISFIKWFIIGGGFTFGAIIFFSVLHFFDPSAPTFEDFLNNVELLIQ